MVTDNRKYKEVVALRGPEAQSLLNLLQARLDFYMEPQYKPRHVKALVKLSQASGLYPECLTLKGVEIDALPVDGGSFVDVYRGRLNQTHIAVKVLRDDQTSDIVQLLKLFHGDCFPTPIFCLSTEFIIWTTRHGGFV